MIGYIFLITIAILISTVVYQQMKTYVPSEKKECVDGVSIFLKESTYNCENKTLNLVLKNNGRFGIAGYFIKATDALGDEIATIDLSSYTSRGKGGVVFLETLNENSLKPGNEVANFFDLTNSDIGTIYSLEITPMRYEEVKGKKRVTSCGSSEIKEALTC